MGSRIRQSQRPETDNLWLYSILSGKDELAAAERAEMGWGQFKPLLTEATVALTPIQARYELINDPDELNQVLSEGREKASCRSSHC